MAGKVIAITGANGGLGRAMAQQFLSEGHKVVLLGRTLANVQEVAAELGDGALAVQCEVSSPDSVRSAFAKIAETYPKIDVLINNAAVFGPYLIEEASDAKLLNSIMSNLAGPMFTARSAIPMMQRGAQIINISTEALTQPFPHQVGYQSTKAGVETFSEKLHVELEDQGIRVSCVRAGQMVGPGATAQLDAESGMKFFEAAMKKGFNPAARPMSQFSSVAKVFSAIVNAPADVHIGFVTLEAFRPE